MGNEETNKDKTKSSFNFFAILEDTISGVIEFALRFISVTLLCIFRPKLCIARYQQPTESPISNFPRPYTYLVISIFIFIKGLHWISQTAPAEMENSISNENVLVKIHSFVDKLGDVSTLQIILSVFPTIVVILFLSMIVTLLHKPFAEVNYRKTSHAFSYIFGSQIVGALLLITLFVVIARLDIFDANLKIASASIMIGIIALAITTTISLKTWFDVNVKHTLANISLYLLYATLAIAISFSFYSTIVAAYTKLESQQSGSIDSRIMSTGDKVSHLDDINITVYHVESNNKHLIFSLFLQNNSDIPYYLHGKGSAMVMNILPTDLSRMLSSNNQANQNLELLHEYLKLMKAGYARVDLKLVEKLTTEEHIIRPGQHRLVAFEGSISDKIVLNQLFTWIIRIPMAGFNPDGTLTYTTMGEGIGSSIRDIYMNLNKEKMKTDKEIDENVVKLQQEFEKTRQEIERLIEQEKAVNIDP